MVTSKTLPSITPVKKIRTHRSAHSKVILPAQREKKVSSIKKKEERYLQYYFICNKLNQKPRIKKLKEPGDNFLETYN